MRTIVLRRSTVEDEDPEQEEGTFCLVKIMILIYHWEIPEHYPSHLN